MYIEYIKQKKKLYLKSWANWNITHTRQKSFCCEVFEWKNIVKIIFKILLSISAKKASDYSFI